MNETVEYIKNLNEIRREKINSIINYIVENYPNLILSCDYAPKTRFPVFKSKDNLIYIGIASQKQYISIHFSKYECTEIVKKADERIKTGVGCVKIKDNIPFPLDEIKMAIDNMMEFKK